MYDMAKLKIVSKSDLLVLTIKSIDNIHIALGLTHQLNMSYHLFMMFGEIQKLINNVALDGEKGSSVFPFSHGEIQCT